MEAAPKAETGAMARGGDRVVHEESYKTTMKIKLDIAPFTPNILLLSCLIKFIVILPEAGNPLPLKQ